MKLGTPVSLAKAGIGRVLLRRDVDRSDVVPEPTLFVTTAFLDPNESTPTPMSIMLDHKSQSGMVHTKAYDGMCWDVTECAEFRPDLTTHRFSNDYGSHGQMFLNDAGRLAMFAHYSRGPTASGMIFIALADGQELKPLKHGVLRFTAWRLVAAVGDNEVKLFDWPPKDMPKSTGSWG